MTPTTKTKDALTGAQKAALVRDYEANTTGSATFTRHWSGALIYTEGVHMLAETCGAHWLVDLIASYQIDLRVRTEGFQVWELTHPDDRALWVATMRADTDEPELVRQEIEYSDFPAELSPMRLWLEQSGDQWILMLPRER